MASSSRKWLWILLAILLILIVVGVVGKKQGWVGKKNKEKVAVELVKRGKIIETVSGTGKIYPKSELKLSPDVSGEVIELLVEEGDTVKKGQLLARIEPEIYQSMIERADAAVNASKSNEANAEAQLKQLDTQIEKLVRDFERTKKLFEEGVVSKVELDNAATALASARENKNAIFTTIKGSGYNTKSAQANLKEARENLRKTNLYAPMSGIVSLLNIKKGERVVGTSQFQGTEIMRIATFDEMEAQIEISETDVLKLTVGDSAIVELDAYLDRKFEGIVTRVSSSAKSTNLISNDQTANFTVYIKLLPNSYNDLIANGKIFPFKPGMSASADIKTNSLDNILLVPIQSVTTREDTISLEKKEEAIHELVFVVSDGKVYSKIVETGIQDDTFIQVLKGVEEGNQVVAAPFRTISKKLKDSLEVEVVKREDLFEDKK